MQLNHFVERYEISRSSQIKRDLDENNGRLKRAQLTCMHVKVNEMWN